MGDYTIKKTEVVKQGNRRLKPKPDFKPEMDIFKLDNHFEESEQSPVYRSPGRKHWYENSFEKKPVSTISQKEEHEMNKSMS
jgi:hypothetical protein